MQRRVLVRARGLGAFRQALVRRLLDGTLAERRKRLVIVPTRAAAELLREACELDAARRGVRAVALPDFATRAEWLLRLPSAVPGGPSLLTRTEREVLLARAARETITRRPRAAPSFVPRPGLIAAMLDFHDALARRQRSIRRFARVLFDELRVEEGADRGSESLIRQTRFLGFTFLAYRRLAAATGAVDEHELRRRLLETQPELPFDHLVIAVADHPSDPRGLWPADFDLLGRLKHLSRLEVVVTEEVHDAGFRDRMERELPELEEERAPEVAVRPDLVGPAGADSPVTIARDREDELRHVARVVRARATSGKDRQLESAAVVSRRPLPYLYLAEDVFAQARIHYRALDAQPLATEPCAALVDLLLTVARTDGLRDGIIALLRSPLVEFRIDGELVGLEDVAALDAILIERRMNGLARGFAADVDAFSRSGARLRRGSVAGAARAARAAAEVTSALASFRDAPEASAQVGTLGTCLRRYERSRGGADLGERARRARAAVLAELDGLSDALRLHDNGHRPPDEIAAMVHHALEGRTFTPRRSATGVCLVDASAARFGDFDHVHLVGLVETDWPERSKRGIFYPVPLLKALGWPQEGDHARAENATFRDLFSLANKTTELSAFQLEGDAVASLSPIVETIRDLSVTEDGPAPVSPAFLDDLIAQDVQLSDLPDEPAGWLTSRHRRPALSDRGYTGFVGPVAAQAYRVSRVDRFVDCPFKYFAESLLALPEERDEISGLSPLERGTLLHSLFERFYREWQTRGRQGITAETVDEAREVFAAVAREALSPLHDADRVLEETRLLGSIVARGVADKVFELEIDAGRSVSERWLERDLRGSFSFPAGFGPPRIIDIRGKADRIDLLDDGSLRVVDYKLGRMPDLKASTQIAVYALCAQQLLERETGRPHPVSGATYLAFGDEKRLEGKIGSDKTVAIDVENRAAAFAIAVNQIEKGEFPPRPRHPADCQWCGYAGVCRKEYAAEVDDSEADAS